MCFQCRGEKITGIECLLAQGSIKSWSCDSGVWDGGSWRCVKKFERVVVSGENRGSWRDSELEVRRRWSACRS